MRSNAFLRWAVLPLLAAGLGACDDTTGPGPEAGVTGLEVSPGTATLFPGDTVSLATSVTGGAGDAPPAVAWSSADSAVASVSAAGLVTARSAGEARIVARVGQVADTAVVRVMAAGMSGVPYFTVGESHACYLDTGGRAFCWGRNGNGELGNGTTAASAVPVPVSGGLAFVAISAGSGGQTCALTAAGEAYCWGQNAGGQLGDGTRISRTAPVRVIGGATFSALHAGSSTCGVTRAGGAFCWGPGFGAGSFEGGPFVGVAAGFLHSCALKATGEAVCRGYNTDGRLGNPTAPELPGGQHPVVGGHRFLSIATGPTGDGTCGVTVGGKAYCWGSSYLGSLGIGTRNGGAGPAPMEGDYRMLSAVPGRSHGCGITLEGGAVCWGNNVMGQLGDGSWRAALAPTPVQSSVRFTAVLPANEGYTCAITAAREPYCWGKSTESSGVPAAATTGPMQAALTGAPSVLDVGRQHGCALVSGSVQCWGDGSVGRLGTGSTDNQLRPARVQGAAAFTTLSVGLEHSCAIAADGTAFCWGANYNAALGEGTTTARSEPTRVQTDVRFSGIAAGENHTCAVTAAGEAYCWGIGINGATATAAGTALPRAVSTPLRFASIVAGANHTCALTQDGTAYCWGYDVNGQLGTSANTETCGTVRDASYGSCSRTPIAVAGGLRFARLSAGTTTTCGITTAGDAYCWGAIPRFDPANSGELGNGATAGSQTPVGVSGGHRFAEISTWGAATCGVTTTRELLCWGSNANNAIALGTTASTSVPARVSAVAGPVALVTLGNVHGCASTTAGATVCWGARGFGLIGDGQWAGSTVPLRLATS
jgi:alpha-tubulin suppressor-like RCC1 family protein